MSNINKTTLKHNHSYLGEQQKFSTKETKKIQNITTRAEACANDIINLSKDYIPNQTQVIRHYHYHDSWYWTPYRWDFADSVDNYCNSTNTDQTPPLNNLNRKQKKKEVPVIVLGTALLALGYSFYSAAKISAQKIATSAAQKKIQKDLKQTEKVKEKSDCLKKLNKIVKKESHIINRINDRLTRESLGTAFLGVASAVGLGSYMGQSWELAYAAGTLGSAAIGTWMVSWYKNHGEEVSNQKDAKSILRKIEFLQNSPIADTLKAQSLQAK